MQASGDNVGSGVISSASNPLVKRLAKLREQGRFRREEGAAVLAGAAPVRELCGAGCVAEGALRTLLLLDVAAGEADWHREYLSHFPPGVQVAVLAPGAFRKATGVEAAETRQAAAELALPPPGAAALAAAPRVLVLDRVQDPGNVGTLLRSAVGFGWDAAALIQGCDPFNDKALRASRGAPWRLPVAAARWEDVEALAGAGTQVLVADMGGAAPETFAGGAGGVALVLSSEGAGVSAEAEALLAAGRAARVGVPLRAACESLNVGVAGGILMYVLGARE